jgi:hypothetical protein
MAKAWMKPAYWPLRLRWPVAMFVVPVLPFAVVAALAWISVSLRLGIVGIVLIALAYAMLLFIPAAWISFLPTYLLIDRWGGHSKSTYQWAAVAAASVVAFVILCGAEIVLPSNQGLGAAVAFGLVVALPTSAFMGSMVWCVLWSGRVPDLEASKPTDS